MSRQSLVRHALDPNASVVVEACAGSGKTWLLVSRLLRLLLAGARPGEILAITYTRKAAREIEERLRLWLRQLATLPDAAALEFLCDRGLDEAAARTVLPRARGLLEAVLAADPPITLTTFHGWFARLLGGAPLASGLAGYRLTEAEAPLRDEAWARFARQCAAAPDAPPAQALLRLFADAGAGRTRDLLHAFVARRAEWHAFLDDGLSSLDSALESLRADLGVGETSTWLADFWGAPGIATDLQDYARLLGANTDKDMALANALADGLIADDPALGFAAVRDVVLTQKGELRSRKPSGAQAKRLGGEGEARLLDLHARLGERLLDCLDAQLEERIYAINHDVFVAASGLLKELEELKAERRMMDFSDLEWHTDRLLRDVEQAPFLQARLDARYRHILLDEFQDTNPLQWRILLAWLDAYGAEAGEGGAPRIFLVGDPKQSIYRFRRADYRIFHHASSWLEERFAARKLDNDSTFRNAAAIVEVVNALFSAEPAFVGFRPQTAVRVDLPGRVELLPLCRDEQDDAAPDAEAGLRNPLSEPPLLAENRRRRAEAALVAERIRHIVECWPVYEGGRTRPANFGDVLILTRRRGVLPEYERALREAGIPYLSVSRGGLLKTLEAADLGALLRWLVEPGDDLALAHALRTPFCGLSDDELLMLAALDEPDWWSRLGALAQQGHVAPTRAWRLLAGWRELAVAVPVHDLLDRIYHEGEVLQHYQATVPPAMWPGVRANLEAFIALALELDGGRYPSLSRFLDELSRLGQAGDEEAPDEGVIQADGDAEGRVRIMTVHGAKGLEAPFVWLIDANNAFQKPDNDQVLLDWQPGEDRPRHFSLATRKEERGRRRAALFEAEEAARERETLNLLYVAITRAEQCFFASGSVALRNTAAVSDYQRIAAALARLDGDIEAQEDGASLAWGADFESMAIDRPARPPEHATGEPPAVPVPQPVGERRQRGEVAEAGEGAAFGVELHACLEALTLGEPPPSAAGQPALEMAERILAAPQFARFFSPEAFAWARNEVEFMLPGDESSGQSWRLGRIDRLVDDGERLWVLDYKSGRPAHAPLGDYFRQLAAYRTAVAALWPGREVRCALIFGDASLVELDER